MHWVPDTQTDDLMSLILLNKPFGVLCQFTDKDERSTLADYVSTPGVYPAGRLDRDSEGLLVLTDDGVFQARLSQPGRCWKSYWVQVEGEMTQAAIERLTTGVTIRQRRTRPCRVAAVPPPEVREREPPVRLRRHIPTSWLELELREGRNRQIRKMTAAVGNPTLRLIRFGVGPFRLDGLAPGETREISNREAWRLLDRYRP